MPDRRSDDPFRRRALNRVGLVPSVPVTNHGRAVFSIIADKAQESHKAYYEELMHLYRILHSQGLSESPDTDDKLKKQLKTLVDMARDTLDILLAIGEAGEIVETRYLNLYTKDGKMDGRVDDLEAWRKKRDAEIQRIAYQSQGRAQVFSWLKAIGMMVIGGLIAYLFDSLR